MKYCELKAAKIHSLIVVSLAILCLTIALPRTASAQGTSSFEYAPEETGGGGDGGGSGSTSQACFEFREPFLPKKIINRWSGKCLNVLNWGLHDGANVVQATNCDISTSMWWVSGGAPEWPTEYVNISSVHSRKHLTVVNNSQSNGANVVQGPSCSIHSSHWRINQIGAIEGLPVYTIRARHSDQCLNVLDWGLNNGANVVQARNCSVPTSHWFIIPSDLPW